MAQKVIIDADPGIGDAAAVTVALLDPELDVVGLTATAGRVSGYNATRNIQAILDLLDPPKWPRTGSSDAPMPNIDVALESGISPVALNGKSGFGNLELGVAELHHHHQSAKLMIELVRNEPHEISLLTLGPLTNVEVASELAPEFRTLLKQLICLGGSVEVGGDVTPAAEFNIFANPPAARSVLRSSATKTLVPLDVTDRVVLTFQQFDQLSQSHPTNLVWLLDELVPFALRAHHEQLGLEGLPLHEVVALATIARPKLFQTEPMSVDVETAGELTRGMTVFDRRRTLRSQSNIEVVRNVDADGVTGYFQSMLTRSRT